MDQNHAIEASEQVDREMEIDIRIQTIESEVHELGLVLPHMSDEQIERMARAALQMAQFGMMSTAAHRGHVHTDADGADGRDAHAS